jgi:hypothetical protein
MANISAKIYSRKVDKVTDWEVNWSKPLPHLFKSKSVLIGDAAHSVIIILISSYMTQKVSNDLKDASIHWPGMLPGTRRRWCLERPSK